MLLLWNLIVMLPIYRLIMNIIKHYEGSYLPGLICNIIVKADLGRSASRSTPTHPQMHHGIYIMEFIWQPFWILQER